MQDVSQEPKFDPRELRFAQLLGMPLFMVPHLDAVADPIEIDLALQLGKEGLTVSQVAEALRMPQAEATEILERAFCREVVNREERDGAETVYTVATFFRRMDVMGTFETAAWNRLPPEVLELADQWYSKAYAENWQEAIDQIKIDPDHLPRRIDYMLSNRDILLKDEAIAMVEAATLLATYPCGCQGLRLHGETLYQASIRLDEQARLAIERGQGTPATTEEVVEMIRQGVRDGRVITGLKTWPDHEVLGLGLCVPDYGYSFTVGAEVGLKKLWPRAHYLAEFDMDRCTHCGLCPPICPFNALSCGNGAEKPTDEAPCPLEYEPANCWGCGLCVEVCPDDAITMKPLTE